MNSTRQIPSTIDLLVRDRHFGDALVLLFASFALGMACIAFGGLASAIGVLFLCIFVIWLGRIWQRMSFVHQFSKDGIIVEGQVMPLEQTK